MNNEVTRLFDEYIDAFNTVDANRIAKIYHCPCLTVRADGSVYLLSDQEDVRQFMGAAAQNYYDEGNRAGTYDSLDIRPIGDKAAVADVRWSLRRDDGSVVRHWSQTYNLILLDEGWKFVLTTMHR